MKSQFVTILAFIFSSPALANPNQFDLICRGQIKRTKEGATENSVWTQLYRIDLGQKIFCTNKCGSLEDIYDSNDGRIILNQYSSSVGTSIILIDRMSGALTSILAVNAPNGKEKLFESVKATCQVARFSGIPRKF